MRATAVTIAAFAALALSAGTSMAEESGAPAAPSGAPASAAQQGSSTAGEAASKNEMSSHDGNAAKQGMQADPHKQSQ